MNRFSWAAVACVLLAIAFPTVPHAQSLGQDRVIDTKPAGEMQRLRTTTAFNGWIFAAYGSLSGNSGGITIRKSTDAGQTWTMVDSYSGINLRYPNFDLIVTGSDVANLKLFVVGVNQNLTGNTFTLYVDRYNASTSSYEGSPLNLGASATPILDVAIASDYLSPAVNAQPYGVGLAWVTGGVAGAGQVKFLASNDAGATFDAPSQQTAATATGFHRNVSLAYGRSASGSNGRYYVAWDEFTANTDTAGRLFTSRNVNDLNSPLIAPVRLDDLTAATAGKCNTPKIAVHYSNVDSDASGPTAVVLANCEYGTAAATNVLGFYNKRSHFESIWSPLSMARVGTGNQKNATIVYNSRDSTFVLTYLDAIANALVFKSNDFNLTEPNAWKLLSSNYASTTTGLAGAAPQIGHSPASGASNFSWINRGTSTDIAYFDSGARSGLLDIDDDKSVNAITDGLLVVRYMLGFRGAALINGAVGAGAARSTAPVIEAYLRSLAE